jgi:hypothetical protein
VPPAEAATTHLVDERPYRIGIFGGLIGVIFSIFELAIFVVLAPVRIISLVFGRGMLYVIKIPLQLLGALMRVFGYLLIIGLLVGLAAVLFAALLG